jgi:hypothetical protein
MHVRGVVVGPGNDRADHAAPHRLGILRSQTQRSLAAVGICMLM